MSACWRPMTTADLAAVQAIAAAVHPAYPERPEVFAERLRLAPGGCFVQVEAGGRPIGYALSHPWDGAPPALDTLLGALPPIAGMLYIHDIALLPLARGQGAGADMLALLIEHARGRGLAYLSLVAVNGSAPYWQGHGFRADTAAPPAAKLASYGEDAIYMSRAV